MALLVIIVAPVLPALHQAQLNHRYAISRRQAQGLAVTLAHEVRSAPGDALDFVQAAHRNNPGFSFRATMSSIGDNGYRGQFFAGNAEMAPPFAGAGFRTDFEDLFTFGTFVVTEVFDDRGYLAGLSVAKIN